MVLPDGTAERTTFLIVAQFLHRLRRITEPVSCGQKFVAVEVIQRAVESVLVPDLMIKVQRAAAVAALFGAAIALEPRTRRWRQSAASVPAMPETPP